MRDSRRSDHGYGRRSRSGRTCSWARESAWRFVPGSSDRSAFVYQAEHGVNKLLASPFDALWWGVTTLTTVGYGDTYPVTQDGRLGAMVLMLLGIGLFSAITATITSYFISQETPSRDIGDRVVERLQRLAVLRREGSLTEEEFAAAKTRAIS